MTNSKMPTLEFFLRQGIEKNAIGEGRAVIALGTFDGVHIAHRALLDSARELKQRLSADLVGVWCFDEIPAAIIHGLPKTALTSVDERVRRLIESGADFVAVGRFDELRNTEACDFVKDILIGKLGCVATVCGYNHRFGRMGLGDPDLLEGIFGKENTVTVSKIEISGQAVSSSAIREHLKFGNPEAANKMLGRRISLSSVVTEGKKLGRRLGFPTANQAFPDGFVPLKRGVYATLCSFDGGEQYMGVTNVGVRPSIDQNDDHRLNCETYIIDFSDELYGRMLTVEFCAYLREEKKFSSVEELSAAIEADRDSAIKYFEKNGK